MLSSAVDAQLSQVLRHLYINPLEKCNLKCKICYTKKTAPILSADEILAFIERYQVTQPIETVTFCGGEVFALLYFTDVVNELTKKGIFVQVITNGTIDRLDNIHQSNAVNLIVSLDGMPSYHDKNRGAGNFAKSLAFMKKAHALGFHLDVISIVTKQHVPQIDAFEQHLLSELGFLPGITYHPRKPPTYLLHHPVSNIFGETDGFDFLSKREMIQLMRTRHVFPPKDLGCYQIAAMSDGKVYGCCEGVTPIGTMHDKPAELFAQLRQRLEKWSSTNTNASCLGCSQSEFMCGIKEYLAILHEANNDIAHLN